MKPTQKEVLTFLNKEYKPFKTRGKWYDNFVCKNKDASEYVHWGSIGIFLAKKSIAMLDVNNKEYDFTQDIIDHNKADKKWQTAKKPEWDWLLRQQKAFEMLGKGNDRKTYNEHIFGIIGLLQSLGYSFKALNTENKSQNIQSFNLPSCQELVHIAKKIRNESGNLKKQPQPKHIFSEWEKLNNNIISNEIREQLINDCFRQK